MRVEAEILSRGTFPNSQGISRDALLRHRGLRLIVSDLCDGKTHNSVPMNDSGGEDRSVERDSSCRSFEEYYG